MNREQIKDWFSHPVGRELMSILEKRKQYYGELLLSGKLLTQSDPLSRVNQVVGKGKLLDEILSMKILEGENNDTEGV
jgi:hypothetical protein